MFLFSQLPNARVFDTKSGPAPHSPATGAAASPKRLSNVAYIQSATEPVWARISDSQPTKMYPPPYLVQGLISQDPQPDFKIVSVSIFPRYILGICYWTQLCSQTQEWLTDRGTSTCASRKAPPPQLKLWIGLLWLVLL